MCTIVITGSANGLGKALHEEFSHFAGVNAIGLDIESEDNMSVDIQMNVVSRSDWESAKRDFPKHFGGVDILINCVGVNYICPFEEIQDTDFDRLMGVNVKSILVASQALLPQLKESKGTIVNVISNASHMPMTDSFVYNATKGASEIATRQMARELTKRHGITVFGISPNKLSGTKMSEYIDKTFPPMRGLTYEEGREYQLNGMLTGKETDPKDIAELMGYLLTKKVRHEYLSGCVLELGL